MSGMAAKCPQALMAWPAEVVQLQLLAAQLEGALSEAQVKCNHAQAARLRERLRLIWPLIEAAKSRRL